MTPNPRTYIGSGKVAEIKSAIQAFDIETVIFDDELSPGLVLNDFTSDAYSPEFSILSTMEILL